MEEKRKVDIIEDLEGKKVVVIHDILFKGRRIIDWDEVKKYLRQNQMQFKEYLRFLKLQMENISERIKTRNIFEMLNMDGTDMTPGLHYQFMTNSEKLNAIMCFMHQC